MSAAITEEPYYVDVRKWPDSPHWHYQVFELGSDAHGRWFCLPEGSSTQRRPEPPRRHPGTTAKLLPTHGAWVASFNAPDHRLEVYVDVIAEPATFRGRTVTMIDVDLDVARDFAGTTHVLDVDELEEHRVLLRYPDAMVAHAQRTAAALREAVATRKEPFDRDGLSWLKRARARPWPIDERWIA